MDYVTVRALRENSGEIWQRIEAGEEFVITRNGKPFALLVHTEPQAVAAHLRALRLSRMAELVQTIRLAAHVRQGLGARRGGWRPTAPYRHGSIRGGEQAPAQQAAATQSQWA